MTTPNTGLVDRLWDAITEVRVGHPRILNDAPTDDVVAAVLPIVAEAVKAGKAEALRDAAEAPVPRDVLTNGLRPWLRTRADQIETGDTDEH